MEHFFNCHGEWVLFGTIAGSAAYVRQWIRARWNR